MTARSLAILCMSIALTSCASTGEDVRAFDITHVTLYDCGLAQMERQTTVSGAEHLEIRLSRAHLDDLLASLTVATDGGVKVRSVRFPLSRSLGQAESASSMGQKLAERREGDLGLPSSIEDYAASLIGLKVAVARSDGRVVEGTLAGVSEGPAPSGSGTKADIPARSASLIIILADGSLTWVPLSQTDAIRPLSGDEAKGMVDLASQMGSGRGLDEVIVSIETSPDSSGRLAAAYVRQSPLWRMQYRVTPQPDGKVMLEAWAVVHNDTPEDWRDVHLTLLSGLPQSYVLSLASPRYMEREVLADSSMGILTPQLGAQTPDDLVFGTERYQLIGYGGVGGGYGSAAGSASYSRSASASVVVSESRYSSGPDSGTSSLIAVGQPAAEETAEASVEGEIALYNALDKVTVPAGTSGLVPLIRRQVPGQAFSLVTGSAGPRTCIRMENSTGLLLQPGLASFYIGGRFRGESEIDLTDPSETRVWCFGGDAEVTALPETTTTEEPRRLEWKQDKLLVHSLKTSTYKYTITNDAGLPRSVAIEVTIGRNTRLVIPAESVPGEGANRLVIVEVPARTTVVHDIVVEAGVFYAATVSTAGLKPILEAPGIPQAQKDVVNRVLPLVARFESLSGQSQELASEVAEERGKIESLRLSLSAVPAGAGASKAVDTLTRRILDSEDRVSQLTKQIETISKDQTVLWKDISKTLSGIQLEPNSK